MQEGSSSPGTALSLCWPPTKSEKRRLRSLSYTVIEQGLEGEDLPRAVYGQESHGRIRTTAHWIQGSP